MSYLKFLVGTLVRIKSSGQKAIVEGDYAFLCDRFSKDDYSLSLAILDDSGKIMFSQSWFSLDQVEMLPTSDSEHMENIAKLYNYSHFI